ncbi:ribosomal protein S27a [Gregarina niphandrodes]|uniref:Ribosomal protein S27a n=1 Tax=Gregarina niphandrodes TaxID=110365 RepID=A0A023AXZ2_GRENI|nr:ribosomal protein S27a [Gregarina niphandrodes]EZG43150.1 ribosomal protein S27a [Gregarina niphandrodes]|eukprot:XP_011133591.1 ribosomal protein S27a [Gregarina niphandrodes]
MRPSYISLLGDRRPLAARNVEAAKAEIAHNENMSVEALSFSVNGLLLEDETLLAGDIIVAAEVDGGAKGKKKKKNYTTPKHVSHKRRKVKLAILKYYSINDGKIQNLRTNCIGNCPDGVKMAIHHNRSHCGRCGITMFKEDA